MSTPDPPGPPGLTSSAWTGPVWWALCTRTSERWKVFAGSAWCQSWGTWIVAQLYAMSRGTFPCRSWLAWVAQSCQAGRLTVNPVDEEALAFGWPDVGDTQRTRGLVKPA